ncbi:hypothetical protein [Sphingomonas sp. RS2018]
MAAANWLPSPLVEALVEAASLAAEAVDPWWIIGSAAVVLHGVETPVADIDLLTSARDADSILAAAGRRPDTESDRSRFRSVYGTLPSPGVSIEVMGGLEVLSAGAWHRVLPATRQAVSVCAATLYVPDRAELAAIMRSFGRAKDIIRAALLD